MEYRWARNLRQVRLLADPSPSSASPVVKHGTTGNASSSFAFVVTRVVLEKYKPRPLHTQLCFIWRRSSTQECQHHLEGACGIVVQYKVVFIPPTTTPTETSAAYPRHGEKTVAVSPHRTDTPPSRKPASANPTGPCPSSPATTRCTLPTRAATTTAPAAAAAVATAVYAAATAAVLLLGGG